MGAWIETAKAARAQLQAVVAPYVGAWIETLMSADLANQQPVSHPTWVRGLKPASIKQLFIDAESHPTWVRGLKL